MVRSSMHWRMVAASSSVTSNPYGMRSPNTCFPLQGQRAHLFAHVSPSKDPASSGVYSCRVDPKRHEPPFNRGTPLHHRPPSAHAGLRPRRLPSLQTRHQRRWSARLAAGARGRIHRARCRRYGRRPRQQAAAVPLDAVPAPQGARQRQSLIQLLAARGLSAHRRLAHLSLRTGTIRDAASSGRVRAGVAVCALAGAQAPWARFSPASSTSPRRRSFRGYASRSRPSPSDPEWHLGCAPGSFSPCRYVLQVPGSLRPD